MGRQLLVVQIIRSAQGETQWMLYLFNGSGILTEAHSIAGDAYRESFSLASWRGSVMAVGGSDQGPSP